MRFAKNRSSMIKIEKLDSAHVELVNKIELAAEQVRFAETAEEFLNSCSDEVHLYVIISSDSVVGFFKLDTSYASNYSFCSKGSLGLRSFVIDKTCQGEGIGQNAIRALFPYLRKNYPEYHSIYLTVNCENPRAVAFYKKSGFLDTDEKYFGGAAGPQHIMYRKIT